MDEARLTRPCRDRKGVVEWGAEDTTDVHDMDDVEEDAPSGYPTKGTRQVTREELVDRKERNEQRLRQWICGGTMNRQGVPVGRRFSLEGRVRRNGPRARSRRRSRVPVRRQSPFSNLRCDDGAEHRMKRTPGKHRPLFTPFWVCIRESVISRSRRSDTFRILAVGVGAESSNYPLPGTRLGLRTNGSTEVAAEPV
jgi:hypothetical protein